MKGTWELAPPSVVENGGVLLGKPGELTIQIMNRLPRCLGYFTGCVPDCSDHLIDNSFVRQLSIAGRSANALFEFAGQTAASSIEALLRPPQRGPSCSVLNIIVSGRIPRTRLIERNIRRDTNTYTRENPSKSFHSINLHFLLDAYTARGVRRRCPDLLNGVL
jgi:hypothetical protein